MSKNFILMIVFSERFHYFIGRILGFVSEGSICTKLILCSVQFILCESTVILSMIERIISIQNLLKYKDIPNCSANIMTLLILSQHTMMNSRNHLMLIHHIITRKVRNIFYKFEFQNFFNKIFSHFFYFQKCDSILKITKLFRYRFLLMISMMIIIDLIVPFYEVNWFNFMSFHFVLIMSGKMNMNFISNKLFD